MATGASAAQFSQGDALFDARLLLVDDNDTNLVLLQRVLQSAGFRHVLRCMDSRDAMDRVRDWKPDAVLLDVHMPHRDGFAILEDIRTFTNDSEFLPVVALTADATSSSRDRMLAAGAQDYLTKPFAASEVVLKLCNLLRTRRLQQTVVELLDETLTGAVQALLEVLALANPVAFSRASRIAAIVDDLTSVVRPPDSWSIKVAAAISQIGAVALSPDVAAKLDAGRPLSAIEQEQVARLPALATGIVEHIPQLQNVAEILRFQRSPTTGQSASEMGCGSIGANILRVAVAFDELHSRGFEGPDALAILRSRDHCHDPSLLDVLDRVQHETASQSSEVETTLHSLRPGMTLARDVVDRDGTLLISRGHSVSERTLELLRNRGDRVPSMVYVFG